MKELVEIQKELKAPKNQRNNFGNYNYRSCEDILEAVKPLAHKLGCSILLSDDIKIVGERVYVVSKAQLFKESGDSVSVTAYAREPLTQKGMNEAQITGSASSYARKYALNGLFAIDDTKDSDSEDNTKQKNKQKLTDDGFKYLMESGSALDIELALRDRYVTDKQNIELVKRLKSLKDGTK